MTRIFRDPSAPEILSLPVQPRRDPASIEDRTTGIRSFVRRVLVDRNLYGALAFAETAESLVTCGQALDVRPGERVAGVVSSGDVLLSLLSKDPEAVVGFDMNPTQVALADFKLAAISALGVDAYLSLLGVAPGDEDWRIQTFQRISRAMPGGSRAHLLGMRRVIGTGILNAGMTHLIIRALVGLLRRLVDRDTMALFLGEEGDDAERSARLAEFERSSKVRTALLPFLRRFAPELKWLFFPHKLCRVSDRPDRMIASFFDTFRPLFEHGARSNPVLCRSATGELHEEWRNQLYNDEVFARIAERKERVSLHGIDVIEGLGRLPEAWAHKIYLSNVPDYLNPSQLGELVAAVRHAAAPDARVLYFSLCDEDRMGSALGPELGSAELAAVRNRDNVFIYPSIVVRMAGAG